MFKISEQLLTNMASMPLLGNVTSSAQCLYQHTDLAIESTDCVDFGIELADIGIESPIPSGWIGRF